MGFIGMCLCGFHYCYEKTIHVVRNQLCSYVWTSRLWFSSSLLWDQRVWVQIRMSFSRKLTNWLKILVQTRETAGIATQEYKNQIGFVLVRLMCQPCASDLSQERMGYLILSCLSSFWKTATLGQWGGGGEGGNLESFVKYRVAKFT